MKRAFYLLTLIVSLMFTSCITDAQVISEYYDYNNNCVVVYVEDIPYYRIREEFRWIYRPVPRERYRYISINPHYDKYHDMYRPRPMQPHHDIYPPRIDNQRQPISGRRDNNHPPFIINKPQQPNRGGNMNRGSNSSQPNRGGNHRH